MRWTLLQSVPSSSSEMPAGDASTLHNRSGPSPSALSTSCRMTIAVVTHAIVIRLLVLSALGLGPERLWSVDASPAGISELELGTDWSSVHRMNTLAHLSTWGPRN